MELMPPFPRAALGEVTEHRGDTKTASSWEQGWLPGHKTYAIPWDPTLRRVLCLVNHPTVNNFQQRQQQQKENAYESWLLFPSKAAWTPPAPAFPALLGAP